MATQNQTINLTDAILTEIIARLPLRIIARFKLVSKTWKSTIESLYFRRLFVSLHQKSSTSWSLMNYGDEFFGFHGCETWDLQKSLSFYIPPSLHVIKASSHGLVLISDYGDYCFVGNPVLRQWIKIPPAPGKSSVFGLVTRVDDYGFVLGFKVVRLAKMRPTSIYLSSVLNVFMYSSETGIWTSKTIHCPYQITNPGSLTLAGTIYFSHLSEPGLLVAHDFYSESSDQFRVIPLPDHPNHDFKSALTSSGGFAMYIRTLSESSSNDFKAWRLNNDSTWQLLWNIALPISLISDYVPMAMHPFDSDIVYFWSRENRHLVSCNLRTQNNRILGAEDNDDDHEDYISNKSNCEKEMDEICGFKVSAGLLQLVLPRWMESVPRPPQVEIMNTTSVISYVTSMQETRRRNRDTYGY
ncbi:unnamed protein product [Arabidopsis arenosa]|uniref:F-box domain-containing protein n=1 Tax=Arabidopsis arenosa TaxID=38785 RepID=A0A8S2AAZ7_ARAAE|nr:unnamed protein product [Arabidopsis arenosa]